MLPAAEEDQVTTVWVLTGGGEDIIVENFHWKSNKTMNIVFWTLASIPPPCFVCSFPLTRVFAALGMDPSTRWAQIRLGEVTWRLKSCRPSVQA